MPILTHKFAVTATAMSSDTREAPNMARANGFSGLLFDAYSPAFQITELSGTGRREFLRVLAAADQSLVGLRADLGPKGFAPGADVDRLLSALDVAMEAAAGLHANLLTIDLGPLPSPTNAPSPKPTATPEQAGLILIPDFVKPTPVVSVAPVSPADLSFIAQLDAALSELADRADRYGVNIAMSSTLAGHASIAEVLDRVRCPMFGVELDAVSVLRDDWSPDEIFSRLGPLLRHVRARDAALGEGKRTKPMPISRGDTKWGSLLDALRDADYSGWITVDPTELPDRLAAARAAVKYLREVMEL